jgi:hypothetical protein
MHEIAQTRIRDNYRRVHIMLKRDGWSSAVTFFKHRAKLTLVLEHQSQALHAAQN